MRTATVLSLLPLALAAPSVHRAPLVVPRGTVVEGKYIVKMKTGVDTAIGIQSIAAKADRVFKRLGAFAATLTEAEVELLQANPLVSFSF